MQSTQVVNTRDIICEHLFSNKGSSICFPLLIQLPVGIPTQQVNCLGSLRHYLSVATTSRKGWDDWGSFLWFSKILQLHTSLTTVVQVACDRPGSWHYLMGTQLPCRQTPICSLQRCILWHFTSCFGCTTGVNPGPTSLHRWHKSVTWKHASLFCMPTTYYSTTPSLLPVTISYILLADINMLSDWTMQNNMTIIVSKCKAMHISRIRYKCPPPLPLLLNSIYHPRCCANLQVSWNFDILRPVIVWTHPRGL